MMQRKNRRAGRMLQERVQNSDAEQPSGSTPLIALRAVSRLYDGGAIAALTNVDLAIEAGDCVAVVGASGSGKSTPVNPLCGIHFPSAGTGMGEGKAVAPQR